MGPPQAAGRLPQESAAGLELEPTWSSSRAQMLVFASISSASPGPASCSKNRRSLGALANHRSISASSVVLHSPARYLSKSSQLIRTPRSTSHASHAAKAQVTSPRVARQQHKCGGTRYRYPAACSWNSSA
jgi:hypothetical protein